MHTELTKVNPDDVPVQLVVPTQETVQLLKRAGLHPGIQKDRVAMFEHGHMSEAVRKAPECFEKLVQDTMDDHKTSGESLILKAFDEQQLTFFALLRRRPAST